MTHGYKRIFESDLPGKPLPYLTEYVLAFGLRGSPTFVNLGLGLVLAGLLFYLEFGTEKRKAFIPFFLSTAFLLVFFEMTAVFVGLGMPGVSTVESTTGMSP
jgi:hypothetical protein